MLLFPRLKYIKIKEGKNIDLQKNYFIYFKRRKITSSKESSALQYNSFLFFRSKKRPYYIRNLSERKVSDNLYESQKIENDLSELKEMSLLISVSILEMKFLFTSKFLSIKEPFYLAGCIKFVLI